MDEVARRGFAADAGAYERGRPSYPAEVMAYLHEAAGIRAGARVVEVAAGTGKLTRLLTPRARVVAIEPVREMIRVAPGARLRAVAEALPVRGGVADAVVVGQAFHWFANAPAVGELRRVLRGGGVLALVWNLRSGWQSRLDPIFAPYQGAVPRAASGAWRAAFTSFRGFTDLALRAFDHVHTTTRAAVIDRVMSVSFMALLPDAEKQRVKARVETLLGDRETIDMPYVTEVWTAKAV